MEIINISDRFIVPTKIERPTQNVRTSSVSIIDTEFTDEVTPKKKHAAEPLKNIDDILRISHYYIDNHQYRNNLLFIMGINFGLRCGDLLRLKVGHILTSTGSFKEEVVLQEEKTNKYRTCYLNDAVMDAAELYFTSIKETNLNDFLFTSLSNNNNAAYYDTLASLTTSTGKPVQIKRQQGSNLCVESVEREVLKKVINGKLGINVHAGTHLLRKTFAYHVIMSAPDRSRAIEFLQKILGHSSQSITLAYAGITSEEIKETCKSLNLGYDWQRSSGLYRVS